MKPLEALAFGYRAKAVTTRATKIVPGIASAEKAIEKIVEVKKLRAFVALLSVDERTWLCEAIENPDTLFTRERMQLLNKLVELNLVVDDVPSRDPDLWVDEPPLEKDPELGIGRYVAWQTPLHREAVKKKLCKKFKACL